MLLAVAFSRYTNCCLVFWWSWAKPFFTTVYLETSGSPQIFIISQQKIKDPQKICQQWKEDPCKRPLRHNWHPPSVPISRIKQQSKPYIFQYMCGAYSKISMLMSKVQRVAKDSRTTMCVGKKVYWYTKEVRKSKYKHECCRQKGWLHMQVIHWQKIA